MAWQRRGWGAVALMWGWPCESAATALMHWKGGQGTQA